MKAKKILLKTILLLLFISTICIYTNNSNIQNEKNSNLEGITLAISTPSGTTNQIPASNSGLTLDLANSQCNNGISIHWDYYNWKLRLDYSNFNNQGNNRSKCNLTFKEAILQNIEYVMQNIYQTGSSFDGVQSLGKIIDANGNFCTRTVAIDSMGDLRYVGANPCNYVSFNGEKPVLERRWITTDENGQIENTYTSASDCNSSCTEVQWVTGGWRVLGLIQGATVLVRNEMLGAVDNSILNQRDTQTESYISNLETFLRTSYISDDIINSSPLLNLQTNKGLGRVSRYIRNSGNWQGFVAPNYQMNTTFPIEAVTGRSGTNSQAGMLVPYDYVYATGTDPNALEQIRSYCLNNDYVGWKNPSKCAANSWLTRGPWNFLPIQFLIPEYSGLIKSGMVTTNYTYYNKFFAQFDSQSITDWRGVKPAIVITGEAFVDADGSPENPFIVGEE